MNRTKATAALEKLIVAGVKDLDSGRLQVYDDATLLRLADKVNLTGRKWLSATMEADPTKAYDQDDASSVATLRRVDATGFIQRIGIAAPVTFDLRPPSP